MSVTWSPRRPSRRSLVSLFLFSDLLEGKMARKSRVTSAHFLCFNLLLFARASAQSAPSPAPAPVNVVTCVFNIATLGVCVFINLISPIGSGTCYAVVQSILRDSLTSCLCLAARVGILGLNIRTPSDITLLLNIYGVSVLVLHDTASFHSRHDLLHPGWELDE